MEWTWSSADTPTRSSTPVGSSSCSSHVWPRGAVLSVSSCSPGSPPSSEVPAGSYPFMVTSEAGRRVPVVQAYAFGKYLGYLKVTFDAAGDVVAATGNPILLDGSVTQGQELEPPAVLLVGRL